ncbi:pseudaminic acid cytidylyltransferase [Leptospira sp. 2 VSF19]|uniref:Pseudaminic acid cytidylyltransferase n=1 Tax=Leptospira soteropolitanensis TaxID=2950025 RepID=A0AAW5VD68_9LEPT|nr:pseudaminic acid cytidylyltransferase [Leptospira soteropolitanensis]MCW7493150.1 pseudaminic acid cytidylyltransferase [Leptospira soteropolitanensis]MCW7500781.1 pseudaminic acid cytidylyltransferase [Leptospira soteropolitanensis]MCW7523000.1 pseudaminic acid cytidylyltransferase [Leptospira soteropolitanensis]MCW7526893.1 pseudaminic acid cytidylyltransferase [Leptospira soteropolitanensis]MCW7530718.1 pseudaminic acid cytidylyltransferase [Leptospira soteropolitanensis]
MSQICVIPARGGSKRIPRKNIKTFSGKPMIAHSIHAAKESQLFERVIVSTDDEEIAHISRSLGAEVPFLRSEELSNDYATTTQVISHAIEWLIQIGEKPSSVCCIYATAPLIQVSDLLKAYEKFSTGNWEFVFAATSFGFPIFRSFRKDKDDGVEMFFPEHFNTRSQDLPEAYHDAGQFYWGSSDAWLKGKQIFDKWSTIVQLPSWRVQDIDTMEDWQRAEKLYKLLKENQ